MANKWPERRLDEVTQFIVDCPHSTPKWTDSGVVVLRSPNIRNGRLDLSALSFTTEEGYQDRIKRAVPTPGDLVLTREAPMGEVCQIPDGLKCCLGQRMVLIRVDDKIVDAKYLLFTLQSPYLQHQISWNEGTGTTVSNIRLPNLRGFQIPLPELSTQKAIANILGTLDDKIELNCQMNATLEAMAQALFKSWFVDFDPVIDNALAAGNPIPEPLQARADARKALGDQRKPLPEAIQNQFPDRFVFNDELGWVPEGWEVLRFGDLIEKTIGGDWGKEAPDEKHQKCVSIIRGTDIPSVKLGAAGSTPTRWVENKKFTSRELQDGDIVIEVSGGSPKQPTGRSAYITQGTLQMLDGSCVPASFCRKFRPKSNELGLFAAQHLLRIYSLGKMWGYQNQSTGISNFQTKTFLEVETLTIPNSEDILSEFYRLSRPLIDKTHSGENEDLANLRDTLLPKLLSGQLRVPDAERLAARAT